MPHVLNLYDGTTTITLASGTCILGHYVPQAPKKAGEPVTEPIEVTITGASTTAMQTAKEAIDRMFEAARLRAESEDGPRIFLQYQPIGDATLWRSEILDGRVEPGSEAMTTWSNAKMGARLIVTRAPFFEGALTQAPLTNGNGTNNTSGLTVWAHDDSTSGEDNYAGIASGVIGGAMPTPAMIYLANATGSGQIYANFYIANNMFDTSMAHIIEGEDRQASYGTVGSGSPYSNGQYLIYSVNGTSGVLWDLSSTTMQKLAGRHMRLMAKMPSFSTSPPIYVRPYIKDATGLVTLRRGQEVKLSVDDNYFQDLGVLPFPPGGNNPAVGSATLYLEFRTSQLETIHTDFMQLTPADPLRFRHFVQRGLTIPNGGTIIDDGIERQIYYASGGASYEPKTLPLHLWPGVAQRLYFLHDGYGATVDWKLNVKVYYRPRRETV